MKTPIRIILMAIAVLAASPLAYGNGIIVPIRPEIRVRGEWAIKYHRVDIQVREQVASVSINQEFVNTGRGVIEVEYLFPVPPDAAIDSMTLIVDGREFAAQLLKAEEARRIYEDIVRRKKDPALLEYVGFGLYKTRAFPLEPGKPVKVVVTYKHTCKKDRDLVEVWYPLNTGKFSAKAIEEVLVRVDIKSKVDIGPVYSPAHDLKVERRDPRHVVATYREKDVLPTMDFQVFYQESAEAVGATLLTYQADERRDGYFMALVSPNIRSSSGRVVAKDVVLVLDTSGSMAGEKIQQARESAQFILRNLNDEDRFNVITYSDSVHSFFDSLAAADKKHVDDALDRVDRITAAGGTNIHEALLEAMGMCVRNGRDGRRDGRREELQAARPMYVIFLTDGRPTVGKTEEEAIIKDATKANECNARLFAFGVGYDVNVRLLDRLVQENGGKSDYVKPKEPIEAKISSFYSKIKNPLMTNLKLTIEGLRLTDMYPRQLSDLFEGDQIVVVGRYSPERDRAYGRDFRTNLVISGTYLGRDRAFEYPVEISTPGRRSPYVFVEKLWAVRRVGWLLDQIQLHGKSQELVDELVRLSKEYGIMTPYTSFLADERTDLSSRRLLRERASREADTLSVVSGAQGQMNAMNRQDLNEALNLSFAAKGAAAGPGVPASAPAARGLGGFGNADTGSYEEGRKETFATVQNVGNQTLYLRGQRWVTPQTAELDEKKDSDKIKIVERFTKEYFELASRNTADENAILATQAAGEELLVELRGQVYLIK